MPIDELPRRTNIYPSELSRLVVKSVRNGWHKKPASGYRKTKIKATFPEIETYLQLLEETPQRLLKSAKSVDETRLHQRTAKEPWSVNDILAHLRACADVWGDSIAAMLVEDRPTVPYRHPRQWIKKRIMLNLIFVNH